MRLVAARTDEEVARPEQHDEQEQAEVFDHSAGTPVQSSRNEESERRDRRGNEKVNDRFLLELDTGSVSQSAEAQPTDPERALGLRPAACNRLRDRLVSVTHHPRNDRDLSEQQDHSPDYEQQQDGCGEHGERVSQQPVGAPARLPLLL